MPPGYQILEPGDPTPHNILPADVPLASSYVAGSPRQNWVWAASDVNEGNFKQWRMCKGKIIVDGPIAPGAKCYFSTNQSQVCLPNSRFAEASQILSFTAQTTTASTYGMLQLSLLTALDQVILLGYPRELRPSRLLDTPQNISAGWGSLSLGTAYLLHQFRIDRQGNPLPVDFTYRQYLDAFVRAWIRYNQNSYDPHNPYGESIAARVPTFRVQADTDPLHENYLSQIYDFFVRQNNFV